MDDNIGAKLDRIAQSRSRHSVIHNNSHTVFVSRMTNRFKISNIPGRIADSLAVDSLGLIVNQLFDGFRGIILSKTDLDALAG